jgi:acyl-CoA synthetase (AMP-forming)/AMP-acid ligase II
MPLKLLHKLEEHAVCRPQEVAVREVGSGRSITWEQWRQRARAFARRLHGRVAPGSAVIIGYPNVIEFHIAFMGVLWARCRAFPVSPEMAGPELLRAARESRAAAAVGAEAVMRELRGTLGCVELEDAEDDAAIDVAAATPADVASAGLLLQSSGTMGAPKIVVRDGDSLDAVANNMCRSIGFTERDRVLAVVPLCHSYGLEHGLLAPLVGGSGVSLCRGLDVPAVSAQLERGGITIFPAVPPILEMLAGLGDAWLHVPNLRRIYSAGGPLPRSIFDAVREKCGLKVGQLYGATEFGSVTFGDSSVEGFDPASVGQPMEGVAFRIAENGELLVAAPSMFSEYLGEGRALLKDGFFATGDIGRIDDCGNLTITGRLKLLIDVGGLKVNPIEVEEVLSAHPAVAACIVVPLRVSQTVHRLRAIVTPSGAGPAPSPEELRRFCRERLTPYKIPRVFEMRPSLPLSATGKVLRHLVDA